MDAHASNAWVVHGNHTASGKPLLASDPHLTNSIPSIWYLMSMQYGGNVSVIGSSIPGCPYVAIGRTPHMAWGITASLADVSDLYSEEVSNGRYLVDGNWRDIDSKAYQIKVKGEE